MEVNHYSSLKEPIKPETSPDLGNFIIANTKQVDLRHLERDCIIPVFSKDNESTISHPQFITEVLEAARSYFTPDMVGEPSIRVSHVIKGRTPSAIGKPLKEVREDEKTIYYERSAFMIPITGYDAACAGNALSLTLGGVRAYNQENLYSSKSLEKFKVFIGYHNQVCTNLCVSTDGLASELKVGSANELHSHVFDLMAEYNPEEHLTNLQQLDSDVLSEKQFAHLIGRLRMAMYMDQKKIIGMVPFKLTDSQVNKVAHGYYHCPDFSREPDGSINLWSLYNLLTEANKSSYIDRFLDRGVNAYEFVQELSFSLRSGAPNWFLNN